MNYEFLRHPSKKIRNCLVGTRYSGFGTRSLDISRLKLSKISIIAFRIPNNEFRLSNYEFFWMDVSKTHNS
jgi:hypothetical protein